MSSKPSHASADPATWGDLAAPVIPLTAVELDGAILDGYERLFLAVVRGAARSVRGGGRGASEAAAFLAVLTGRPEAEIMQRLSKKF